MTVPTPDAVWKYRNQPYGYWKAGNPAVKYSLLILLFAALFAELPFLVIQCALLMLFVLRMPTVQSSWILNLAVNFGLGGVVISVFSPFVIDYERIRQSTEVRGFGELDMLMILAYLIAVLALLQLRRAVTSRDIAWLVDKMPRPLKKPVGGYLLASVFSMLRADVLWHVDEALRARGCRAPWERRRRRDGGSFLDVVGIWLLNLKRRWDDMERSVEYALESRIRLLDRDNPSRRSWSSSDFAIAGVLVLVIAGPWIWQALVPLLDWLSGMLQ